MGLVYVNWCGKTCIRHSSAISQAADPGECNNGDLELNTTTQAFTALCFSVTDIMWHLSQAVVTVSYYNDTPETVSQSKLILHWVAFIKVFYTAIGKKTKRKTKTKRKQKEKQRQKEKTKTKVKDQDAIFFHPLAEHFWSRRWQCLGLTLTCINACLHLGSQTPVLPDSAGWSVGVASTQRWIGGWVSMTHPCPMAGHVSKLSFSSWRKLQSRLCVS